MATNKHDVEIMRAHQRGENVKMLGRMASYLLTLAFIYFCLIATLDGLKEIAQIASARQITALAEIIDKFHFVDIVHYVLHAGLGLAFGIQRFNCKRAIRKKAELENQLHAGEPNRSSSNLTKTGETP